MIGWNFWGFNSNFKIQNRFLLHFIYPEIEIEYSLKFNEVS